MGARALMRLDGDPISGITLAVSELVVRYLESLEVDVIFGMPGAHVLPIYDCLRGSSVASVLVKHEQGAAFMAGGYARASKRIAACIATAGPGATNLITGIANAYADRLPVLVITGETSTYIFGKGGLQESSGEGGAIDQGALFSSITRYHKLVERTDYLGQVLIQATRALTGPEPGPVLLSIPYNVQKERVDASLLDTLPSWRDAQRATDVRAIAPQRGVTPAAAQLAQLIQQAAHPVIVAGYGCQRAGAEAHVAQLGARMNIPIATSLKGKGVVAETSADALGCLGVTSNGEAFRYIVEHADLVIFLGAAFNERTSYLWDARLLAGKKLAQVDLDPAQIGKVFRPDLGICGDLKAVLSEVLEALGATGATPRSRLAFEQHRRQARMTTDESIAEQAPFSLMGSVLNFVCKARLMFHCLLPDFTPRVS